MRLKLQGWPWLGVLSEGSVGGNLPPRLLTIQLVGFSSSRVSGLRTFISFWLLARDHPHSFAGWVSPTCQVAFSKPDGRESIFFSNLVTEVPSHHFCHTLLAGSKPRRRAYTKSSCQEAEITKGHLRACLPQWKSKPSCCACPGSGDSGTQTLLCPLPPATGPKAALWLPRIRNSPLQFIYATLHKSTT